jgi:phospholipase A1/A2
MNVDKAESVLKAKHIWLFSFLFLLTLFTPIPGNTAEIDDRIAQCAKIEDGTARLRCFDDISGRQSAPQKNGTEITAGKDAPVPPPVRTQELSVLTRHWDLNTAKRKHSFALRPYRLNYFLPVAYNASPNEDTALEYDPRAKAQHNEAKFQLSFKVKIWEDLLQNQLQGLYDKNSVVKGIDIWVAYTQMSFWQLYNSAFSAPFRDTNYEPEFLFNFRSGYEIPGLMGTKLQFFNVGFNHQSNGRSVPLSRSWNRVVANIGLERNNFNLMLKTWYRLPEDPNNDDNPDLTRYMGYGELWATLFWEKQRFAVMLRNNLRQNNLGAVQLDWSIPPSSLGKILLSPFISQAVLDKYLTDKFSLYVQYFNGYGEGLMDYNTSINRISMGFMIAEWN